MIYNSYLNTYVCLLLLILKFVFFYFMYCILQDLSLYRNDELLHESLYLLNRILSAEESLFENASQTQVSCVPFYATVDYLLLEQLLITDESKQVHLKVLESLPKLHSICCTKATDLNEQQSSELITILDQFSWYIVYCDCIMYI